MKIHFISGLPRSGSTLLAALLRQNPRFRAGIASPLLNLFMQLLPAMGPQSEFFAQFTDETRIRVLRSAAFGFHGATGPVIFDTNRLWTANHALLKALYPESKIICCVRNPAWIVDSFENLFQKNPLQVSQLFRAKPRVTLHDRAEAMMDPSNGIIGTALSGLRDLWHADKWWSQGSRVVLIQYEDLARYPKSTLANLYDAIGEPDFDHDVNSVWHESPEYDARLGMPGLHSLRQTVRFEPRNTIIPGELFDKYSALQFWGPDKPEFPEMPKVPQAVFDTLNAAQREAEAKTGSGR
jgi:sulfotransferase